MLYIFQWTTAYRRTPLPYCSFDYIHDGKADCDRSDLHEDDAQLDYTLHPRTETLIFEAGAARIL